MRLDVDSLLPYVRRPATYVGNEFNSIHKNHDSVRLKVALCYPDRYEIGMSSLGVRIVYHLLNRFPDIACERFFAPWTDMEEMLRRNGVPLLSLESGVPIDRFDVVAFSVGYELTYTNILNTLDLSGLPLRSCDREEGHPLVIAGGPSCLNPEPVAEFIDCFFIGDGEDSVKEMAHVLLRTARQEASRSEKLMALSEIPGSYVPSLGTPEQVIRRVSERLLLEDFPSEPIVPHCEIIHDRLAIEVMRGCPRSCKFCQSAVMYGPVRRRSPADILELVKRGLKSSGWEEMSLVSLSPTDYPNLAGLLLGLEGTLEKTKTSLSLSSIRADALAGRLISALKMVRKASITLAPEAGTDRLRNMIGKPMAEEAILDSARAALSLGFGRLKLYFMIGLPSETDGDIDAIVKLCRSISSEAKGRQIRLSVSGFVPKPHTPFEREEQQSVEELTRKAKHIKAELRKRSVEVSWHNPQISFLEAVMSRGDKKLSSVVLAAFRRGCRFDGWSERFNHEKWLRSFEESGIDPLSYTRRIGDEEQLPWSFIGMGVVSTDGALRPEPQVEGETGLCDSGRKPRRTAYVSPYRVERHRVKYMKLDEARFISHLDLMRAIVRTLRRAGVPLAYSQGFSPRPRVSFGPPLSVGMTAASEYFDFMIDGPLTRDFLSSIASAAPRGIKIVGVTPVFAKSRSLSEILDVAEYRIKKVRLPNRLVEEFLSRETCKIEQIRGKKRRVIDVRPLLLDMKSEDGNLQIKIRMPKTGWVGPREILSAIKGEPKEKFLGLDIERTGLYTYKAGVLCTPIAEKAENA
ncbi:MAG: TIGR03960 family B12-binding radical SAM protein [bacterium]